MDALKNPVLLLKTGLVVGLLAVVGMAFRVSWNALKDVALAIGADDTAATLYAFVIDGLMVVALVASLYLDKRPRTFALCVLGGYTLASLVLNYVHGLVPELHEPTGEMTRLAEDDRVHNALVLLATSLPVGSIFFGSHLVATVLHHRPAPARHEIGHEKPAERDRLRELAEVRVARTTGSGYAVPEARTRSDVDAGTHEPVAGTPEPAVPVAEPPPVPAEVHVPETYPTNGYARPDVLAEESAPAAVQAPAAPEESGPQSATVDGWEAPAPAEPTEAPETPQSPSVDAPSGVPEHLSDFIARRAAEERVFAADQTRTRAEVHAEYVEPRAAEERVQPELDVPDEPAAVPGDEEPRTRTEERDEDVPAPDEDPLTDQVRREFADVLAAGKLPPFRELKGRFHINQDRAKRIRDELAEAAA